MQNTTNTKQLFGAEKVSGLSRNWALTSSFSGGGHHGMIPIIDQTALAEMTGIISSFVVAGAAVEIMAHSSLVESVD